MCLKLTLCLQIVIKNLVGDGSPGLQSVGQVSRESYLPDSKMYLCQMSGQGFLATSFQTFLNTSSNFSDFSLCYACGNTILNIHVTLQRKTCVSLLHEVETTHQQTCAVHACIIKFNQHVKCILHVQLNLDYPNFDYPDFDYPDYWIIQTFFSGLNFFMNINQL